jgi:hypothetical protein
VYEYHRTRSGKTALEFLENYHGHIQSDDFAGYDHRLPVSEWVGKKDKEATNANMGWPNIVRAIDGNLRSGIPGKASCQIHRFPTPTCSSRICRAVYCRFDHLDIRWEKTVDIQIIFN